MILGVDIGNIKTIDESKSNSTTKILDELKKEKKYLIKICQH